MLQRYKAMFPERFQEIRSLLELPPSNVDIEEHYKELGIQSDPISEPANFIDEDHPNNIEIRMLETEYIEFLHKKYSSYSYRLKKERIFHNTNYARKFFNTLHSTLNTNGGRDLYKLEEYRDFCMNEYVEDFLKACPLLFFGNDMLEIHDCLLDNYMTILNGPEIFIVDYSNYYEENKQKRMINDILYSYPILLEEILLGKEIHTSMVKSPEYISMAIDRGLLYPDGERTDNLDELIDFLVSNNFHLSKNLICEIFKKSNGTSFTPRTVERYLAKARNAIACH